MARLIFASGLDRQAKRHAWLRVVLFQIESFIEEEARPSERRSAETSPLRNAPGTGEEGRVSARPGREGAIGGCKGEGKLARIAAIVYVEKESQKAIVIGKRGELLKAVGTEARIEMERLFGMKVFLELWVKVKEGWRQDEQMLSVLGY